MSYFSDDAKIHDFFVGITIKWFQKNFHCSRLIAADGASPFPDTIADSCPTLSGYRPDAIVEVSGDVWLVEVKSFPDIFSIHTAKQFTCIRALLKDTPTLNFLLSVFRTVPSFPFLPKNAAWIEESKQSRILRWDSEGYLHGC